MASTVAKTIGERIRAFREEAGLSLSRLASDAEVSKGYLWSLEHGETDARPSGRTLYRIAKALGITMSDLLGEELLTDEEPSDVSESLRQFAKVAKLTKRDVAMLARVNFRGQQPQDPDSWWLVWSAIKTSSKPAKK